MEVAVWFLHSILFLEMFECFSLDNTNFTIGILLHPQWKENSPSRKHSCFDLCQRFCVNIEVTQTRTNNSFSGILQDTSLNNYDVIITDGAGDLPLTLSEGSTVIIPQHGEFSQAATTVRYPYSDGLSGMRYTQETVNLPTILKEFVMLYLKEIKTDTIVIFHDDATAHHTGDLLDYFSSERLRVTVLVYSITTLQTQSQWEDVLIHIHRRLYTKGVYVLLHGLPETVLYTLKTVNSFDGQSNRTTNFRHLSYWLVLTNVTVADVYLPVVDKMENVVIVDIFSQKSTIQKTTYVWNLVQSSINGYFWSVKEAKKCLNGQKLKTDFIDHLKGVINSSLNTDYLTIWTLTGVGHVSEFLKVEDLDIWNGHHVSSLLYPNKKYHWNGVHLQISTKPWPGYVKKITNGNQTFYDGMCIELLKSMADALNFTYTIREVPDGEWGAMVNESWTGLIRQLQDRVIDLAVADIGVHSSRDTVMDYVYPGFKTEVIDILYRLHSDSDMTLDRLTNPLKPIVLPVIGAALCTVTLLYVAMEYGDGIQMVHRRQKRVKVLVWNSVWYLVGSILSQGGSERPRSCSSRLLIASWWLFCVVFAATYSATLTMSFCVQRTVVPFRSLHDMVYYSDYKWGMFNGSLNMLHFSTSETPLNKATFQRMMEFARSDPNILSKAMDVQLDKVVNDKYAFISSRNSLNVMIQRAPKGVKLVTLGETLYPTSAAFGVPTNSPRLRDFERIMQTIKENGFFKHWNDKYWNKSQPNTESFQLGGDPLPLKKILNAFCIIGFGVAAALIVLSCEKFLNIILNNVKKTDKINTG